jgi:CheY-like chemotaxis protein
MLARILNNLVSNALRYTKEGGLLVAARAHGGNVRIDVWDTGSGIAAEHLERIFDEFFRVDSQGEHGRRDSSGHRGLGLGLATVHRLAELIGTHVTVASKLGRGSVFSFSLPEVGRAPVSRPAVESLPIQDVAGMRVLVVDDEPAILSGIRFLLVSWGCEVAVARDREEALHVARSWNNPPNLVISDLHLGEGQSGVDVMAELSAVYGTNRYGAPPFARLLITGETRRDRLHRIVEEKIPLLYKPVGAEELREAIAMLSVPVRAAS